MLAKLIALVLPLGLDTLAVAAAIGVAGIDRPGRRRISLIFVLFEAGIAVIAIAAGAPLARSIGGAADYVAISVLLAFGLYILFVEKDDAEEHVTRLANASGPAMLLLGISISLDELAIGFTLGLLRLPVLLVVALIAIQTLIVTQVGLRAGHRLGRDGHRLREGAERLAGAALTLLALFLLLEKTW